jgi:hypothetical protein
VALLLKVTQVVYGKSAFCVMTPNGVADHMVSFCAAEYVRLAPDGPARVFFGDGASRRHASCVLTQPPAVPLVSTWFAEIYTLLTRE